MNTVATSRGLRIICVLCSLLIATKTARAVDHRIELDAPWPKAADVAPGDRILLAAGLHASVMVDSYRGTAEAPIIITSAHPRIPAGIGRGDKRPWSLELRDCDHVEIKSMLILTASSGGIRVVGPEKKRSGSISLVDIQVLPPKSDRFSEFGISAARLDHLDLAGIRVYRWRQTGFDIEDTGRVRGSTLVGEGTGQLDSGLRGLALRGVDQTSLTGCSFIGMARKGVSLSGRPDYTSSLRMDRCVFLNVPTPVDLDSVPKTSLNVDLQRSTIVRPVEGVVVVSEPKPEDPGTDSSNADDRGQITVKIDSCLITWTVGRLKQLVAPGSTPANFEFGPNLWWSAESSVLVEALGGFPGRTTAPQRLDIDPNLETKTLFPRNPAASAFGHGLDSDNSRGPE